ncbi:MAG: insulinase family protein [Deltaproteobacteria bacterium]|nr:insulinase family protein [Deltaproteobacteria bacterium]
MRLMPYAPAVALALALAPPAADVAAAPGEGDPKIPFEMYKLDNGLEVILVSDRSAPIVAVNVWYHVGSGHETHGKSGFAHLFEHMMFQGSKHVGDDRHFEVLRKIGAEGVNGTTNPDRTNYFEVVPSNQLETGLWLESDRLGFMLEKVTKKSLDNQIEVVRNERRQRYDNVPYQKARFALAAALYPEGHPYRYLTIGRHEDLLAAGVEDVKDFFRTWYVPANATLTLVGDFDVAAAKKLVDKWFGKFPKSVKPTAVKVPAPPVKPVEVVVDDEFAKLRQVTFAWGSPANFAEGDAELDIAASALVREGPGRLYKTLVYDKQLAQSVSANQYGMTFSGQFTITVTLRPDADLAEVKRIVGAEVARLAKEPLGDREIARVIVGNESFAIRRFETVMGRAEQLQAYNHYLGNPDKLTWDLDRYRKATPEAIRATVAKYLVPDRFVTIITNPKEAKR